LKYPSCASRRTRTEKHRRTFGETFAHFPFPSNRCCLGSWYIVQTCPEREKAHRTTSENNWIHSHPRLAPNAVNVFSPRTHLHCKTVCRVPGPNVPAHKVASVKGLREISHFADIPSAQIQSFLQRAGLEEGTVNVEQIGRVEVFNAFAGKRRGAVKHVLHTV